TQVPPGGTLTVDKLVTIYTSRDESAARVRQAGPDELHPPSQAGVAACHERNHAAWQAKWIDSDVTVDGDADIVRAARFNIYHLLIAANGSGPGAHLGGKRTPAG